MGERVLALALVAALAGAYPEDAVVPEQTLAEAKNEFHIYLGAGCYWARQKFTQKVEEGPIFDRIPDEVSALTGYAGATKEGPGGLVCYHGGPVGTIYSDLGYAEAVQVRIDLDQQKRELQALFQMYFRKMFQKVNGVWIRLDPEDRGRAYRSIIGLPGGMKSPLLNIIKAENVHGMLLKEGKGSDPDEAGTVWVYDSKMFPFRRAERYMQFWHGPKSLKKIQEQLGRINPTGCPEMHGPQWKALPAASLVSIGLKSEGPTT